MGNRLSNSELWHQDFVSITGGCSVQGFSHWKWWPRRDHDPVKTSKRQAGSGNKCAPFSTIRRKRTVTMASTSNAASVADQVPDNSHFDLGHAFATDSAFRRATPRIYQYLADQECNDPSSPNLVDNSRACQTLAFEGWVSGGQEDANTVPMQLLKLAKQEENDLLLIYPKAKVQASRITTEQYIFVVKRFLFWYKVTENSMADVPHSQAFARLLRRLSRELRSAPPTGFQLASCSDPCDSLKCLDEMLRDIEETRESLKASDPDTEYVYVGRSIDTYVQCLIAAATELYTYN